MMGLLIKDFKLLKLQKNMLLIMIAIALMFLVTGNDVIFMMSYLTFIATFFVTSTISYDEYNNSNLFLLTLPITRKDYAKEKYILGLLVCTTIWLISTIACTIYKINIEPQFDMMNWLAMAVLILCIPLFTLSFMIPTQIKFGGEKGRIAMFAVVGIAFFAGFGFVMLCQYFNINIDALLNNISNTEVMFGTITITILVHFISYLVSLRIMKNKEF